MDNKKTKPAPVVTKLLVTFHDGIVHATQPVPEEAQVRTVDELIDLLTAAGWTVEAPPLASLPTVGKHCH